MAADIILYNYIISEALNYALLRWSFKDKRVLAADSITRPEISVDIFSKLCPADHEMNREITLKRAKSASKYLQRSG